MKTINYVQCPKCMAISIRKTSPDGTQTIIWQDLTLYEKSALYTINKSKILTLVFGQLNPNLKVCDLCGHKPSLN